MKKILFSLFILAFIIVAAIIASPPSLRGILNAIGIFELLGISVVAWMVNSASYSGDDYYEEIR